MGTVWSKLFYVCSPLKIKSQQFSIVYHQHATQLYCPRTFQNLSESNNTYYLSFLCCCICVYCSLLACHFVSLCWTDFVTKYCKIGPAFWRPFRCFLHTPHNVSTVSVEEFAWFFPVWSTKSCQVAYNNVAFAQYIYICTKSDLEFKCKFCLYFDCYRKRDASVN